MFYDASLSGSGKLSCASCHSPDAAYGPPNDLAVQLGGADMKQTGFRAAPSLRYLEHTPNFSIGPNPEMADNDPVPLDPTAPSGVATPAVNVKVASIAKATADAAARAAAEASTTMATPTRSRARRLDRCSIRTRWTITAPWSCWIG